MSLRKRPTLMDDQFGSTRLGTFNDKPILNKQAVESPNKLFVPNLTVPQSLEVITILLLDYQCKGKYIDIHSDTSFRMWFPFAWHTIKEGDTIKNLSINETYAVETIVQDHPQYTKNYVVLRGKTAPAYWHILRFDNKRDNIVKILPSYPDSENKPYEFTKEGYLQSTEGELWADVITYSIISEAPGSLSGKMFGGGIQEMTPKFREEITDNGETTRWSGQAIDTRVRFDFWTQTNAGSERFREWFRVFANKYKWLIEKNGVARFLWQSSGSVMTATRWKNNIINRSAFYDFRTEYSICEELFKIRSGDIVVTIPGEENNDVAISTSF